MNKLFSAKRGQFGLQNLQGAALAFVALVIVLAVGATVLQEFQRTQTVGNADYNITDKGLTGILKFSQFNPIIAIAISAVIILGIITAAFATRG